VIQQIPVPDDSGTGAGPAPQGRDERPRLPGSPRLEYEFGHSLGWNHDTHLGLTPRADPMFETGLGMDLYRDLDTQFEDAAKSYHQAFADLCEWGVVGAVTASAAIVALAPVEGALAGVALLTATGAAVYSYTNIAVHLAGGGNALAGLGGLFSPVGLPVFVTTLLGGASDKEAIRMASDAHRAYSTTNAMMGLGSGSYAKVAQSVVKLGQNESYIESLREKYALPELQSPARRPPVVQPPIRKPGGPVRVLLP
jgi:hypothetical protein